jgi:hypothetical protein
MAVSGVIPAGIGNLAQLGVLYLQGEVSGTIPDLSSLLKLTYLGTANKKITGVPRCDLIIPQLPPGVTRIDERTCSEGTLPAELGQLVKLTYLSMYRTGLSGTIPGSIGKLVGLQNLALCVSRISGTIAKTLMVFPGMMIANCDVILTPAPHVCTLYRFDSAGDRCPSGPNGPQLGDHQYRRCVRSLIQIS